MLGNRPQRLPVLDAVHGAFAVACLIGALSMDTTRCPVATFGAVTSALYHLHGLGLEVLRLRWPRVGRLCAGDERTRNEQRRCGTDQASGCGLRQFEAGKPGCAEASDAGNDLEHDRRCQERPCDPGRHGEQPDDSGSVVGLEESAQQVLPVRHGGRNRAGANREE